MKTLLSILLLVFLSFTFMQCKTSMFVKNPPFKVAEASYQHWIGGQPGVEGINLKIRLENTNIILANAYFHYKKEKLYKRTNDVFTANFPIKRKSDIILHNDTKKEYGNKPISKKFPFQLKENECVISYFIKDKEVFYKLALKKGKDAFYP